MYEVRLGFYVPRLLADEARYRPRFLGRVVRETKWNLVALETRRNGTNRESRFENQFRES